MTALAMTLAAGAACAATDPLAIAFGARPAVEQASLSPDGTRVAVIQPQPTGQGSVLYIADVAAKAPPRIILRTDGKPNRLDWCRWAGNVRLVCRVYTVAFLDGNEIAYTDRLIAVNEDGSAIKPIEERKGTGQFVAANLSSGRVIDWNVGEGNIVLARRFIPEVTTGTKMARDWSGLGVDEIDTLTGKTKLREMPADDQIWFGTDGQGNVRILTRELKREAYTGYSSGLIRNYYRDPDSREWKKLSDFNQADEAGFDPYFVDAQSNVVYGLKKLDGRKAAYSITLDGSLSETLLFASPQVDVDGFVTLGRSRKVVGVSYATDVRRVHYFDPATARLHKALGKAIPNLPLIDFVDSSADGTKLLIKASSDTEAGRLYMFDQTARSLNEVLLVNPALEGKTLARMMPVSIPSRDGVTIPAYLTLPPGMTRDAAKGLPAIVMPHGGPSARDEWGFDWLVQYFAAKCFAVLQPNFRGSEGFGDAWFVRNGFQSWPVAIGDVADAGKWLVAQGIAKPGSLSIFGWSYGGYAALQSAVTEPNLFKAVIAVAPVTDLGRLKEERAGFTDFRVTADFIGQGAHVGEGSPARHAERITAPVLMFHGTLDRNVRVSQSRTMQSRLDAAGKLSELVIFDGLDHYLEDSAARADMLEKSASFLLKAGI